jgi:hypothetical protein
VNIRKAIRSCFRGAWLKKQPYRYHFIHIPKNGGRSIRYALELQGDVSLSRPYHHRYVDIVSNDNRHLHFFCTVRNPWRRTASRYMFGRQNASDWPADDSRRQYISKVTFEQYVKDQKILPIPEQPGKPWMGPLSSWYNQLEWIRDENGSVACDCLRLEKIDTDISAYLRRCIKIPRRNTTQNRYDYRDMYTDELIEIIADTFREDIEYFGFDFEGSATKNITVL